MKKSKHTNHVYYRFPNSSLVYYRNVRSGLGSVLEAIDAIAVANGEYADACSGNLTQVRREFRISEADIPANALTFTIVRNPYKRLATIFAYAIVIGRFYKRNEYPRYDRFKFGPGTDFGDFVRSIVTIPADEADDFIAPQVHRIFDEGKKQAKFIAKLENIAEDWRAICRLSGTDVELPHRNKTVRENPVYWTKGLRNLVYDYYFDDFEVFGYSYDSVELVEGRDTEISDVKTTAFHLDQATLAHYKAWYQNDNRKVYDGTLKVCPATSSPTVVTLDAQTNYAALAATHAARSIENWSLQGTWKIEDSGDGRGIELLCTANGRNQSLYANSRFDFAVTTGTKVNVKAMVQTNLDASGSFDGLLRIGFSVIGVEGKMIQWPSLRIKPADLLPGEWTSVEGTVEVTKEGSLMARPWLLVDSSAATGVVRIRDLVLSGIPITEDSKGSNRSWPCGICGEMLINLDEKNQGCPGCRSQARTRGLPVLLEEHILPLLPLESGSPASRSDSPILGFAMAGHEQRCIKKHFPLIKSASLYNDKYASDHDVGVDVRQLPYEDSSFCAIMGILLFDYFKESEQALSECFRVLRPGGVFFTHIGPGRVLEGSNPPYIHTYITGRPGYFAYVPKDAPLPSIKVGRQWFVDAIARCGFEASHVVLDDLATGLKSDWFIGRKPPDAGKR